MLERAIGGEAHRARWEQWDREREREREEWAQARGQLERELEAARQAGGERERGEGREGGGVEALVGECWRCGGMEAALKEAEEEGAEAVARAGELEEEVQRLQLLARSAEAAARCVLPPVTSIRTSLVLPLYAWLRASLDPSWIHR